MNYLFSFSGRINRAKLWLFILIAIGVWIVYGIVFGMTIGFAMLGASSQNSNGALAAGGLSLVILLLGGVLYLAIFIAALALSTKRLHDRDKGAIWLIPFILVPAALNIYVLAAMFSSGGLDPQHMMEASRGPVILICRLVALALSLWAFVELYCLRGTVGDNRYGPDPLAGRT